MAKRSFTRKPVIVSLPKAIESAIENDPYRLEDTGDYSVTTLIKSPRSYYLQKRHNLSGINPNSAVSALMGQAVHSILERTKLPGKVYKERRLHYKDHESGIRVSGKMDLYHEGVLIDFKVVFLGALSFKQKDWEKQLNLLAYLCELNDIPVDELKIYAIYRDWKPMNFYRGVTTQQPVEIADIEKWPSVDAKQYLEHRVELFEGSRDLADEMLPNCTYEEQWRSDTVYAVKRHGRKKALKLYKTLRTAQEYARRFKATYIETRVGEPKNCIYFCPARPHCSQFAEEQSNA